MASQWAIAAVDNDLKKEKKKASWREKRKNNKPELMTSKSQKLPLIAANSNSNIANNNHNSGSNS